jgi:hypothetical protein
MKVTVTPKLQGTTLEILTELQNTHSWLEHLPTQISIKVAELEDQAVREALIALGWTPPDA